MALAHRVGVSLQAQADALRQNSDAGLSPWFRAASDAAIAEANAAGFDVVSFECARVDALAVIYFEEGVSHAQNAHQTWHWTNYGLGRDVISKARGWSVYPSSVEPDGGYVGGDPVWYTGVRDIFKRHGLAWGGEWPHFHDWPHWQPAALPASPTSDDVALAIARGPFAVAEKYGLILSPESTDDSTENE